MVADHWDSAFEWHAHEAVGRHVGLDDGALDAVRSRRYDALSGTERVVAETARRLVTDGDLDDAAYDAVVGAIGRSGVFELLTLVGYYATLALQLRVFRVAAPG